MGLRRNLFKLLGLFIFALIHASIMAESPEEEFTDTGVPPCNYTFAREQVKLVDRFYCYWEWRVDPVKASASASAPLFHYDECPGENERAWAPERAVQSQTPVTRPWCGMPLGEFPQMIWYDFVQKTTIGKISFRNRLRENHMDNNPTSIEFIASNGPRPRSGSYEWVTLRNVTNLVWSGNNEEKEFLIQSSNQSMAASEFSQYRMYGIRVNAISGKNMACIQNIKFYGFMVHTKNEMFSISGNGNWG